MEHCLLINQPASYSLTFSFVPDLHLLKVVKRYHLIVWDPLLYVAVVVVVVVAVAVAVVDYGADDDSCYAAAADAAAVDAF